MKMMNVEMEFVAFDAQDVIATSGEGGGQCENDTRGYLYKYTGSQQSQYPMFTDYHYETYKFNSGTSTYYLIDSDDYTGSTGKAPFAVDTYFHTSNVNSVADWIACNEKHKTQQ